PKLERHQRFPLRSNIEFAEVRREGIRMRVWERGSGITMACGTGACATLVAAHVTDRSPRKATILMDGGNVDVEWHDDGHVWFMGGATIVYEGDAYLPEG
ncbi:MAG: diaminopimelate epimerase, partial [Muribaculaceae bacterium]|nr:diaminopimelate epimerase [Muribaculaceae bacterium]